MNLSNPSRSMLSKIPGLNKAFDFMAARANNVFGAEHNNDTGTHAAITADSLTFVGAIRNVLARIKVVEITGVLNNVLTFTVDDLDVLTIDRLGPPGGVRVLTQVSVMDTANGAGPQPGNLLRVGRNSSGSGAAGVLELIDKSGGGRFLWIDATGALRSGTAPPFADGSISDTSGTVVGGGPLTLVGQAEGTSTTLATTNVTTFAMSGLTLKDSLMVVVESFASGQALDPPILYNSTDSIAITPGLVSAATNIPAGGWAMAVVNIGSVNDAGTKRVYATVLTGDGTTGGEGAGTTGFRASTFTTAWTGSWTLALRTGAGGIPAGGTYYYRIAVYKRAGQ